MKTSLALHIIGIIFWSGSLLVLTRFLTLASDSGLSQNTSYQSLMKRAFFGFTLSGLVLALITGLYQISNAGMGYYMKLGWFHGKLTLILVLIGVTAAVGVQVKKIKAGLTVSRGTAGMLHGLTSLSLVIIILLTFLGR